MKTGKIPENVLKRSILKQIKTRRNEVLNGAGIGEDCAVLAFGENALVAVSVDSVTCGGTDTVKYAVHAPVNDLAAAGAEPVAVLVSALFPNETSESGIRHVMEQIEEECAALHIQAAGCDTRVTDAVSRPVLTVTGIGRQNREYSSLENRIKPGQDVVVSKWTGLQGTAMIARARAKELLQRYPTRIIEEAKAFDRFLSVVPEAATAVKSNVCAMHDVSEGGIFGALWELAEGAGVGLEIELKKIPVRQETIEVCEFFGINPYELVSGGCLLMTSENGNELVRALSEQHICAAVIGRITGNNDRVVTNCEEKRFLEPPKTDELYKVL